MHSQMPTVHLHLNTTLDMSTFRQVFLISSPRKCCCLYDEFISLKGETFRYMCLVPAVVTLSSPEVPFVNTAMSIVVM